MVDLGEDIWRIIVQFLNHRDVQHLLQVNSLLRDIALDVVHNFLQLDLTQLHDREYLPTMAPPWTSPRVRRLMIVACESDGRSPSRRSVQSAFKSSFRDSIDAVAKLNDRLRGRAKEEPTQRLLNSLTNVRDFCFFQTGGRDTKKFVRHLNSVISAIQHYSPQLSSIDIIRHIVPLLLDLPVIERIAFRLHGCLSTNNQSELSPILSDVIPTFINRHSKTLSCLQISAPFSQDYDLSILFESLVHIPHLQKLILSLVPSQPDSSNLNAVGQLIAKHSETLQSLILLIPSMESPIFNSIFSPLPHLKHLSIFYTTLFIGLMPSQDIPTPNLTEYIAKYSAGLQSFDLSMKDIGHTDWDAIAITKWSNLVSLRLRVVAVTPGLFDDIAHRFPLLKSLSLSVTNAFGAGWALDSGEDTATFYELMNLKNFPESPLSHLELHHQSDRSSYPHVETRSPYLACVAAVVNAFPKIVYVNEHSRGDFFKEAEKVCRPCRSSD